MRFCRGFDGLLLFFIAYSAHAAVPTLYSQPAYESPVRGDPDDLLLVPGYRLAATDTVVYQAVSDTTRSPTHPAGIPSSSTQTEGVADLASSADAPYSLTVHLPTVMTADQSYALWVVGMHGSWSEPLFINDARPLWITPDRAYQTAQLAGPPRRLKVVGRNLQPGPGTPATRVRLVGNNTGMTYTLEARNTYNDPGNTPAALQRYVAAADLPATLLPDQYTVQVSRDGTSWVPLLGNGQSPPQTFTVTSDPLAAPTFAVSDPRFADPVTGPCKPDDGVDDTACILLAVRTATAAGGGTISFDPGTWTMSNPGKWATGISYSDRIGTLPGRCSAPTETCGVSYFGVLVPVGVNLQGAGVTGARATTIERGTGWLTNTAGSLTGFTLQGNNVVSGIAFTDAIRYDSGFAGAPELKLGLTWYFAHLYSANDPARVSNVVISDNLFVRPYRAISTGSLPTDHVYVTSNIFGGAYDTAIALSQDANEVHNLLTSPAPAYPYQPYRFSDSIIAYNTFYPSSRQQTAATYNGGGSVATQINTSLRLDFSNNTADGTSRQYLYDPAADTPGWRAGHFWSTGANQEMMLVSSNVVTCPGDKYGDGESIVYDGSGDLGGMPAAQPVARSQPWTSPQGIAGTTVTARGTVNTVLQSTAPTVDISANPSAYYRGYWLQVVQGAGKGQWRKVESVSIGSDAVGPTVTLNVAPHFDVPPDASSLVVLAHAYWQNATVNNYVDQRTPTCTKANTRGGGTGGTISWYASTADSVIEGNQQYDTSGIFLNHTYKPAQSAGLAGLALQSMNEIRGNLVSGVYHWSQPGGFPGGIQLGYGATAYYCSGNTCPAPAPPDTGFGVSIAHNTIIQADAADRSGTLHPAIGAIGAGPVWNTGPFDATGSNSWELGDATLIFQNTLQNISAAVPGSTPNVPHVGIGFDIALGTAPNPPVSWRSVLHANSCTLVDVPLSDFGLGITRYCPDPNSGSCECSATAHVDVGVTATSGCPVTAAGSSVTYTIKVTNYGPASTAAGVTLFVEPSAGVELDPESFTSSAGSCNASIGACKLGDLPAGQTVTVAVTARLPELGSWPVTFSVTHKNADSEPRNNSVEVVEEVE
jgi:uncharacterized repeat protein (TIGR01451 family)